MAPIALDPMTAFIPNLKSGPVKLISDTQITIEALQYDGGGEGAEVYFIVGNAKDNFTVQKPNPPLKGYTKLADEKGGTGVLKKYTGQTITLTLPAGKKWKEFGYLAMYCVKYDVNFGYIKIKN